MLSNEDKKEIVELYDEKAKCEKELDEILCKVLDMPGNEDLVKKVDMYVKKIEDLEARIFDLLIVESVN